MEMMEAPEVGDIVTIGASKLTWEVMAVRYHEHSWFPNVDLRSGQTDRMRLDEPVRRLTVHTKAPR
jgi:hypothetical protein